MKIQKSTKRSLLGLLTLSFALTCAMAVSTVTVPVSAETPFEITHASVSVGADLSMKYHVSVPDGYQTSGVFSYKGRAVNAVAEDTENANEKIFRFDGITPQNMTEELTLTVHATNQEGVEVEPIQYTYSIKDYCTFVLDATAQELNMDDEEKVDALKTLATDMLNYGTAAQEYTGYKLDELANTGVAQTYVSKLYSDELVTKYQMEQSNNEKNGVEPFLTTDLDWMGARLHFDSYIGVEVAILASTNIRAENIHIKYSNKYMAEPGYLPVQVLTETMPDKPQGKENWQWLVARLEGLTSVDFNTDYTFSVCNENNEEWPDVRKDIAIAR